MLLASGCTGEAAKWERGGWPAPVTKQGRTALHVWQGALLASLIVGGAVLVLIIGAAVMFRRRSADQVPRQVRYNLPIEVLYTFIPVVIVSVLFYFTAVSENSEDKVVNTPNTLQMGVVGFQWSWQFNYLEDGLSITGRPGESPQMVVPTGRPITFYLTSPDVIHSFWVIPFLFKRDVIPGHPNQFQVTVTSQGTFQGRCAEFCGIDHDRMLFTVKALSPTAYAAWLTKAKSEAAAGTNDEYTTYTGPKTGPKAGGYLS
jgi:cytochrome c oxidase subunit 2